MCLVIVNDNADLIEQVIRITLSKNLRRSWFRKGNIRVIGGLRWSGKGGRLRRKVDERRGGRGNKRRGKGKGRSGGRKRKGKKKKEGKKRREEKLERRKKGKRKERKGSKEGIKGGTQGKGKKLRKRKSEGRMV